MAGVIVQTARKVLASNATTFSPAKYQTTMVRRLVTSSRGEILAQPEKVSFGTVKILLAAVPGILVGATAAKNGAAWLEENEIFIPDDDDDD